MKLYRYLKKVWSDRQIITHTDMNRIEEGIEAFGNSVSKATVPDIETLKGLKYLAVGDIVQLNGYYVAGDGAHHKRKIESADDGSGVQLANGLWANIVHNGEVNVSWFGAKSDNFSEVYKKVMSLKNLKLVTSNANQVFIINESFEHYRHIDIDFKGSKFKASDSFSGDIMKFWGSNLDYKIGAIQNSYRNFTIEGNYDETKLENNEVVGIRFNPSMESLKAGAFNLSYMNFENIKISNVRQGIVLGQQQYINSFINCHFLFNEVCIYRDRDKNNLDDSGENITFYSCCLANSGTTVYGIPDEMTFFSCSFGYPRKCFLDIEESRMKFYCCRLEFAKESLLSETSMFNLRKSPNLGVDINIIVDSCYIYGSGKEFSTIHPFVKVHKTDKKNVDVLFTKNIFYNVVSSVEKFVDYDGSDYQTAIRFESNQVAQNQTKDSTKRMNLNNQSHKLILGTNVEYIQDLDLEGQKIAFNVTDYFEINKKIESDVVIYSIKKRFLDSKGLYFLLPLKNSCIISVDVEVLKTGSRGINFMNGDLTGINIGEHFHISDKGEYRYGVPVSPDGSVNLNESGIGNVKNRKNNGNLFAMGLNFGVDYPVGQEVIVKFKNISVY